jgi:hypothetical protein
MARELLFEYIEPVGKYPCYLLVNKEVTGEITITTRSRVRPSLVDGIDMAGNSGCMILPERQILYLIQALAKLIPNAKNLVVIEKPPVS